MIMFLAGVTLASGTSFGASADQPFSKPYKIDPSDLQFERFENTFVHYRFDKPKCFDFLDSIDDPAEDSNLALYPTDKCKTAFPDTTRIDFDFLLPPKRRLDTMLTDKGFVIVKPFKLGNADADLQLKKNSEIQKCFIWKIYSVCDDSNFVIGIFECPDEKRYRQLEKGKGDIPEFAQHIVKTFQCLRP